VDLKGFPRRTLRGNRTMYRIYQTANGAWWFSSDGSGRFDPVGTGHGACYLAERPLGSWVEVFRKQMAIAEFALNARALLEVQIGRDLRLADLTSRRALGFGVTASLGADRTYTDSQTFACDAVTAGFDGIRYLVRHDPAQQLYGIAVFAAAGEPDPADPAWPATTVDPLPAKLADEARRTFVYRILPTP
jgi:RES domain-containing protein